MKNIRKLFGTIAVTAIVILGLTLSACADDSEYTFRFENVTNFRIQVLANDFDPAVLTLEPYTNTAIDPITYTATSKKKTVTYTWNIVGQTEEYSRREVKATSAGGRVLFEPTGTGMATKEAEQE